jgi:hypothetical protein
VVVWKAKANDLLQASLAVLVSGKARALLSLIGMGWISGFTKFPEFFFLLGAFALHGKYLYHQFEALREEYSGVRALNLLRDDWHAPVSALDVFSMGGWRQLLQSPRGLIWSRLTSKIAWQRGLRPMAKPVDCVEGIRGQSGGPKPDQAGAEIRAAFSVENRYPSCRPGAHFQVRSQKALGA